MYNINESRAKASGALFNQVILANQREFEFRVSQSLHDDLTSTSSKGDCTGEMMRQLGRYVGEISTKSKIIRRFQKYDPDNLDGFVDDHSIAGYGVSEIAHHAFMDAKNAYKRVAEISDESFSSFVESAIEERLPGDSVEDRLMEWSIMNNIFEQIRHVVTSMMEHYDVKIDDVDYLVDLVIESCETTVSEFMQEQDKSSSLHLLPNAEKESFVLEVDGSGPITIDDFSDYGVAGILPTEEVLQAISMAGLRPVDVYKELRDEMPKHIMSAWQGHLSNYEGSRQGIKPANVNDFLESLELAEGSAARPVYVFEGTLPDIIKLIDEGVGCIKNPGFTFETESQSVGDPGVIVLEGDIQMEFSVENIKSHVEIGRDPIKNSSLKKGEVGSMEVMKRPGNIYSSEMGI